MVIQQGDLFWIEFDDPVGSSPGYKHPHVVIQNNVFNSSRINTTVVCALTSNLKRASAPGNVLLNTGEGNLPKQSVVVVSQIITVDKTELGEYIGRLSRNRVQQILDGIDLVLQPRDVE
jgi:mRNA interferase MazF